MKLHGEMQINGWTYAKGSEIPWRMIYPFFMLHMLMFGGSGFMMAYGDKHPPWCSSICTAGLRFWST